MRHIDEQRALRGPGSPADWARIIGGVLLIVVGVFWTIAMIGTLLFGILGVIEFDVTEQVTSWPSPAGAVVLTLAVFGVVLAMIGSQLYGAGRHPRHR